MATIAWTGSDGSLLAVAAGFEHKLVGLGYRPDGAAIHLRLMCQLNRWLVPNPQVASGVSMARSLKSVCISMRIRS
jgi:CTP:molybdopterin cytidylyltransferase MocA